MEWPGCRHGNNARRWLLREKDDGIFAEEELGLHDFAALGGLAVLRRPDGEGLDRVVWDLEDNRLAFGRHATRLPLVRGTPGAAAIDRRARGIGLDRDRRHAAGEHDAKGNGYED